MRVVITVRSLVLNVVVRPAKQFHNRLPYLFSFHTFSMLLVRGVSRHAVRAPPVHMLTLVMLQPIAPP